MFAYTHLAHEERYQIYVLKRPTSNRARLRGSWDAALRRLAGNCAATKVSAVIDPNRPSKWPRGGHGHRVHGDA